MSRRKNKNRKGGHAAGPPIAQKSNRQIDRTQRERKPLKQLQGGTAMRWSTIPKIWKATVGSIGLVALVLAFSVLIPHVSVDISEPSDRSDPFSAIATIRNIGIVPLWDIVPSVNVCDLSAKAS
jgi:hypothetical protein